MFGLKAYIHAAGCVSKTLHMEDLSPDPFIQFDAWMKKAKKAGLPEINAMAVCSVDPEGQPSQRMVLLKSISPERGLIFYTNYGSRKAQELDAHPQCALLFHQHILQRQIRVQGKAVRASREESEAYFRSRPRSSQLGAWTSKQSEVLDQRDTFEQRFKEISERFKGKEVPCPEFWGGFRIIPDQFEFWQGRAYRLHDRFVYSRNPTDTWDRVRLYP
ncbi:pyridoxamine 5'-phosphate oxidase [Kiritimatiellota bacterium B12222]|nr:pyridoxamine 5'-phosphate oxidase [Kiritimatiellota bacterium B12222]